jgi:hypothetical protein
MNARRAGSRLGALAVPLLLSGLARAQLCGGRPTDPGGSAGFSYGTAERAFFDSASGRARIHYALAGNHAPPSADSMQGDVPGVVLVAAQAADDALERFEELGYGAPLGDGDSPCPNGESDAIDVYLANFPSADGQAVHDFCEDGSPQRCVGYVIVENDFSRGAYADAAEGLRTVVPHELFHLVQDGYDAGVERWWAEGSAQWAAKQVYPDLGDLERFLPAFFESPWRPLDQPPAGVVSGFLYATAIWPVFLDQEYDDAVLREVFESLDGEQSVLEATDSVLQARGSSLRDAHLQFAALNAATGDRAPSAGGYAAAADYPMVELTPFAAAPGAALSEVAAGLGAFYYAVESEQPIELLLDADPERVAALLVPLREGRAEVEAAEPLPATLEGAGIVVVAGQSLARTDAPFTLRAEAPGAQNSDELSESGCALVGGGRARSANVGAFGGFVVSLCGLVWARARRRVRQKDA